MFFSVCLVLVFFPPLLLKVYAALRDSQLWLCHKQEKCKCLNQAGGTENIVEQGVGV